MLRNRIGLGDQQTDDRTVGLRILTAYYDQASQYPGFQYGSFNDFLAAMERATTLATDIGELIRNTSYTNDESSATSRVIDLANKSQGQAQAGNLIQAAGGSGSSINWSVAVPTLATQIAEDTVVEVGGALQNVGTGVLGTLNMLKYLPWILIGGGAFYLYLNSDKVKGHVERAKGAAKEKLRGYLKRNPHHTLYKGWIIEHPDTRENFVLKGKGRLLRAFWVYHPDNPSMGKWAHSVKMAKKYIDSIKVEK